MYARPTNRRDRGISIPKNYSGNAFSEIGDEPQEYESEESVSENNSLETVSVEANPNGTRTIKNLLPINIGSEELIIIGIALLIFQSGGGDGIIPILLAVLFLG